MSFKQIWALALSAGLLLCLAGQCAGQGNKTASNTAGATGNQTAGSAGTKSSTQINQTASMGATSSAQPQKTNQTSGAPTTPSKAKVVKVPPEPTGGGPPTPSRFPKPPPPPPGWQRGRSSWYGTPKEFIAPFASSRGGGESAFGILEWGGCGYTNSDGTLLYPKDQVTSYADANPDYPGSCGRCYEVKCQEGLVLGVNNTAVDYGHFYYYPKFGNAKDTMNRTFPGNPAETESHVYVRCWDNNTSVFVHVIDICPCIYAPNTEKAPREQASCCYNYSSHPKAGQHEMDMSFWAYEQLAHPMYPEIMTNFRPVDCGTHKPLQFLPGYISRDWLYQDAPSTGWAWFPYMTPTHSFNVSAPGWGRDGSSAACAELSPGGGMTFLCRNCFLPGYQPFTGNVQSIEVWLQDRYHKGSPPPLQIVIGGHENEVYCNNHVYLTSVGPSQVGANGWLQWKIPFSKFGCTGLAAPENLDKIDFINTGSSNTWFCLDDLRLVRATTK